MTVPRTDRRPLSRPDTEGPATGGAAPGAYSAFGRFEAGPVQPVKEKRGPGAAILLVLAPLLCCGSPLLLGALATAGAATLGTVGGVVAGLIAVTAAGFWLRRRRRAGAACCPPGNVGLGR
jgi:hypothetical protein